MKQLPLFLALLLIGCNKDTLETRPLEFGSIAFSVSAPKIKGTTEKVPSCKNIEPYQVLYNLTNNRGEDYTYTAPISLVGGRYVSNPDATLPFGNYTIDDVLLMNGNDTIYALPHDDELDLSPYWDTTLPMDILVNGEETVSGTVFCFNDYTAPDLEGVIKSGFDSKRLQTMFISILNEKCVDSVSVMVSLDTLPPLYPSEELIQKIVIPLEYGWINIHGYHEGEVIQVFFFNGGDPTAPRYNGDGIMTKDDVLIFDYNCI
ncbi:hypothetical protein H4O18_04105 [Arenibacter sp. BSSL-BM3]|uniref:Uncharacterized protein n=1 Tax=Arenibacter arenosicollis TaxID=2762274 RepID=A0ABR7QJ08_9FLAO|nr:hypothetical protein [Arenibacter arenosicollis]MBC8767167.1 hypothetical protein [Arenibacter arenosicollis]